MGEDFLKLWIPAFGWVRPGVREGLLLKNARGGAVNSGGQLAASMGPVGRPTGPTDAPWGPWGAPLAPQTPELTARVDGPSAAVPEPRFRPDPRTYPSHCASCLLACDVLFFGPLLASRGPGVAVRARLAWRMLFRPFRNSFGCKFLDTAEFWMRFGAQILDSALATVLDADFGKCFGRCLVRPLWALRV